MKSKKLKGAVIATIATVAGVFGGLKLYSAKKDKAQTTLHEQEGKEEEKDLDS